MSDGRRSLAAYATTFDGGTARVVHATGQAIYEHWRRRGDPSWQRADLSAMTGADLGPLPVVRHVAAFEVQSGAYVPYVAPHGLKALRLSGGKWTAVDPGTGPSPAGGISAYVSSFDGVGRIVHWAGDLHIHERYVSKSGAWGHGDLTEMTGAPATGVFRVGEQQYVFPHGYATGFDGGTARVVYREAEEGHIAELYLRKGGSWKYADLTKITSAPPAKGHPFGYETSFDGGAARVVYRGTDDHIHELSLAYLVKNLEPLSKPTLMWTHADLTALAKAPAAAGDPAAYQTTIGSPTARVVYRGNDSHIHELYLPEGGSWRHGDLTALAGGPGGDTPIGYSALGSPRVAYIGDDGRVRELWIKDGAWRETAL